VREIINFNKKWAFTKLVDAIPTAIDNKWDFVNLPHCWNAIDGQDGDNDYFRGTAYYAKSFNKAALPAAAQYYLELQGANSSADVYLNGKHLAHHDGGYSTWRVNMTDALEGTNLLVISVDNSANETVYPQMADFTFYGGIYRNVNIICVGESHFDLDYYGTPGLKVTPEICGKDAKVEIEAWVTNPKAGQSLRYSICSACGCDTIVIHPCLSWDAAAPLSPEEEWEINIDFYSSFIPTLKKCGVKCCLENMFIPDKKGKPFESVCSSISTACRYVDTLNEIAGEKLFGFCLDTGHLLIVCRDVYAAITELGDRLIALHVHDNDGVHDDHNAPFVGGIQNWTRFIDGLRTIGYKGNMDMEASNAVCRFPEALMPTALRLLADTANYFRDEVLKS
jgi:sugar phosphate isomerase/epimerase